MLTASLLLTDLYQLTMAYGYWRSGMANHEAVFHMSFRRAPFQGGYALAAGLGPLLEKLDGLRFAPSELDYLASLKTQKKPLFSREFLDYLKKLRFTINMDAVPEGTVVFPYEPLIRVQGSLIQCQLLETLILNQLNFSTLIATKASRLCHAAKGEPVFEFGLRRAQGPDGALSASRAAYLGGCAGTSNVLAGQQFGIPVRGTHAHSWVMAFPEEQQAFDTFAHIMPQNCYLLVDTYHTLQGIQHAITTAKKLKARGYELAGIRLDSGDLAYLSQKARKMLNAAGLKNTHIMGSNDLDEHIITSLKQQRAKIDVWAVGTKLATAYDQPALDGVYKLSAIRAPKSDWRYVLKLSEQTAKISTPGLLRIKRFYNHNGAVADAIYDENQDHQKIQQIIDIADPTRRRKIAKNLDQQELLKPVFRRGKLVYEIPSLEKSRQHAQKELAQFHPAIRRFLNPHVYPVGLEKNLHELRTKLILQERERCGKEKS